MRPVSTLVGKNRPPNLTNEQRERGQHAGRLRQRIDRLVTDGQISPAEQDRLLDELRNGDYEQLARLVARGERRPMFYDVKRRIAGARPLPARAAEPRKRGPAARSSRKETVERRERRTQERRKRRSCLFCARIDRAASLLPMLWWGASYNDARNVIAARHPRHPEAK